MTRRLPAALVAALLFAVPVLAQPAAAPPPAKQDQPERPIPEPTISVTHHRGVFGGVPIAYTATASETYLKGDDGTPRASLFSVAYVKEPRDPSRPVTFLFNGGPGSGSVWLQMGAFGPKRVGIPSDARDDGRRLIRSSTIPIRFSTSPTSSSSTRSAPASPTRSARPRARTIGGSPRTPSP